MKNGFTLIELLAVMLIIAILTGIAMPQYTRSVRRAELAEGLMQGKTIYEAALRYKAEHGSAPAKFDDMDIAFIGADIESCEFDDGNFIYRLPDCNDPAGQYVAAKNAKDDYMIRFMFPTIVTSGTNQGVFAPVACCPASNYVCKNSGITSTSTGMPTNCTELK